MSPLFWLDITFLGISTIIATALALIALGAGVSLGLNRSFAGFILVEAVWALLSIMLRLSLWLNIGNPLLLSEFTALALALLGPPLFLFTAYYVQQQSRQTTLAAMLGMGFIVILAIPLFQHQIVFNPQLDLSGSTSMDLSAWGLVAALVPFVYMLGSLILFWRARYRLDEPYLPLSIIILLLGFIFGGILNIAIPILSITNTFSIILLGYGVISQQLFNPLKERTLELQREIAERMRIEEALRKLWRAIEQSHNTVVITDIQGRIEYSNPKFTQLTGYTPEETLGRTSNILNSGKQPPEFYKELWQTIQSGDVWQGEFHNKKKSGELYWEFASISPVRDAAGTITHFVKVAEDITNRKKSEEVLLRASLMETTATLAGGVAHKVNNLMTAVLGYAELLKSQLTDNPEALNILTIIANSARQTGDLAQQMLAFARGGKYQPLILNLNDIITEVLQLQQYDLPTQINIEQQLAANLWDIEADPTQMSQVVLNLLINAMEAIEGAGRITITTQNLNINNSTNPEQSNLEPGTYICCTLQDSGIGMEPDTQARIFEPFFTTKFQGRGMGLAAVFGIIHNHGGQIIVNSQHHRGTTFKVYLPTIPMKIQPALERQPGAEISPVFGVQQQQTILIVEDDPIITEILKKMMVLLGYHPLTAGNGQEAIELARSFAGQIDLTLLDLSLPVISGAEAFPLLRAAHPTMKVIIYSGYELDDTAQALLDAGASAFIQKPFQLDILKAEIHKALNN